MTHAEEQALYRKRHPERCRESQRKWRREHPGAVSGRRAKDSAKYRERNPEKCVARHAVSHAIRDGKLSQGPCEDCGSTDRIEGHHPDYMRLLDVHWLCKEHHNLCHRGDEAP